MFIPAGRQQRERGDALLPVPVLLPEGDGTVPLPQHVQGHARHVPRRRAAAAVQGVEQEVWSGGVGLGGTDLRPVSQCVEPEPVGVLMRQLHPVQARTSPHHGAANANMADTSEHSPPPSLGAVVQEGPSYCRADGAVHFSAASAREPAAAAAPPRPHTSGSPHHAGGPAGAAAAVQPSGVCVCVCDGGGGSTLRGPFRMAVIWLLLLSASPMTSPSPPSSSCLTFRVLCPTPASSAPLDSPPSSWHR